MKNIQRNGNNFQNNRRFTELPITIITDDEHKTGDNLEMTRQRIEKAAIYLMSIFNLLKTVALANEGQSETREMSGFFENAVNHCEIGYGIADSILASASALTEFQPDEIEPKYSDVIANQYKQTGERLERALASDNLSNEVKNVLEALLADAAIEAGFSIPDSEDVARKFPLIFDALGKSKDSFVVYYNAIETALNHGGAKNV